MKKLTWVVLFSFISFLVSLILQYSAPDIHPDSDERNLYFSSEKVSGLDGSPSSYVKACLSRYESALYRKESPHKPSPYLISKLRQYETLHKRCGPYTESYNRTIRKLEPGHMTHEHETSDNDCKYLVRIPFDGLGNRMLSLASAFLYALLTDRVLLVYDNEGDTADLFCEPFPETTWQLPQDFPIRNRLDYLNQESPECYGNMLKHSGNSSFVYLHLIYTFDDYDKLFFCDQDQIFLQNVSWVIMKSQFYFVPSLFLIKSFEQELATLFPEKETVFHFLGRYLFFPSNPVWELITRYHRTYLAKSDEKIGIQIRTFDPIFLAAAFNFTTSTLEAVPDTILACAYDNNVLPRFNPNGSLGSGKSKSVMVTSLTSKYYEIIRDMYWEHSTVNGDVIGVFQPSSEGGQKTGNKKHDRKALAEIYLLSLTDKLIISPWSTFGYVAQGLGGLRPWILYMPKNEIVPNPPCTRAMSMEPCFQKPPSNGCKMRTGVDITGALGPYIRQCEDTSQGIKLVDPMAS
ncbi:putative Type 1 galactoside alpha-(1,2)-fucosyltransferase [Helianthus debilis subsp. tardiflorus]